MAGCCCCCFGIFFVHEKKNRAQKYTLFLLFVRSVLLGYVSDDDAKRFEKKFCMLRSKTNSTAKLCSNRQIVCERRKKNYYLFRVVHCGAIVASNNALIESNESKAACVSILRRCDAVVRGRTIFVTLSVRCAYETKNEKWRPVTFNANSRSIGFSVWFLFLFLVPIAV